MHMLLYRKICYCIKILAHIRIITAKFGYRNQYVTVSYFTVRNFWCVWKLDQLRLIIDIFRQIFILFTNLDKISIIHTNTKSDMFFVLNVIDKLITVLQFLKTNGFRKKWNQYKWVIFWMFLLFNELIVLIIDSVRLGSHRNASRVNLRGRLDP